jgi:hypothetical protein
MPVFNINEFQAVLNKTSLARTAHFNVMMSVPTGLNGGPIRPNMDRIIPFYCQSTNVPGIALATTEIFRYGYGAFEKKPYLPIFNDVRLELIGDGQGIIWNFFKNWMKYIINFDVSKSINNESGIGNNKTPYEISYRGDYVVDIIIQVYDQRDTPIINVHLRNAYPVSMEDIQLDWRDQNNYMKIPVTFTFRDWYTVNPTSATNSAQNNSGNTQRLSGILPGDRDAITNLATTRVAKITSI